MNLSLNSQESRVPQEINQKLSRSRAILYIDNIHFVQACKRRIKYVCIKQNKLYKKRFIYHLSAWFSGRKLL